MQQPASQAVFRKFSIGAAAFVVTMIVGSTVAVAQSLAARGDTWCGYTPNGNIGAFTCYAGGWGGHVPATCPQGPLPAATQPTCTPEAGETLEAEPATAGLSADQQLRLTKNGRASPGDTYCDTEASRAVKLYTCSIYGYSSRYVDDQYCNAFEIPRISFSDELPVCEAIATLD